MHERVTAYRSLLKRYRLSPEEIEQNIVREFSEQTISMNEHVEMKKEYEERLLEMIDDIDSLENENKRLRSKLVILENPETQPTQGSCPRTSTTNNHGTGTTSQSSSASSSLSASSSPPSGQRPEQQLATSPTPATSQSGQYKPEAEQQMQGQVLHTVYFENCIPSLSFLCILYSLLFL